MSASTPLRRSRTGTVCPTCHRPLDSPQPKQQQLQLQPKPKKEDKEKDEKETMPEWPCPHLAPSLLAPLTKRPAKYFPFVSGQNSSGCTVFYAANQAPQDTAAHQQRAKRKKKADPKETDETEGVVDELLAAYYA